MPDNIKCDFCGSTDMKHVYDPINSTRGMQVHVCNRCGLVQSISTRMYMSAPPGSMSGDANRSSYRYTKELVFDTYLPLFGEYVDFSKITDVLDIGSNRGIFVHWSLDHYPHLKIHGIEPQESVVDSYRGNRSVKLEIARFEDVALDQNAYDFVYCVHTLEHSFSASQMIRKSYRSLRPGGLFFLAVPQTLLFHDDLIEEIFIDPHTFHFDCKIIRDFVGQLGFKTIYSTGENDAEVIMVLQKEHEAAGPFVPSDNAAAERNISKIVHYRESLHTNRERLKKVGDELNELSKNGALVIWGAGRIFDILIKEGEIDTSGIKVVFDKVLYKFIDNAHGRPISRPVPCSDLNESNVTVFVASREYAPEIKEEAKKLGYERIITYADFFS